MIHKRLAFTFFVSVTLQQQATHAFQSSLSVCKTSQSHQFSYPSGLTTTSLCAASNNDNREKDESPVNEKYNNNRKELNRRNAILSTSAALLSTTTLTRSPSRANAEFLPDIFGSSSANDGIDGYKPAKRATAYLVDSTFPPTLIPQKSASREKKILSQIGSGMGTSKSPFIDEGITLNNMMKKAVYGTADTVSSLLNSNSGMNKNEPSFCFLGVNTLTDEEGVSLAKSLIQEMLKARSSQGSTAIGLSFVPKLSGQSVLDAYVKGEINSETALLDKMEEIASVPKEIMSSQLPLINLAKKENNNNNKNKLQLVALGPEIIDLNTVRREGLQNVDLGRRSKYVLDTQGFIELTQNPRFKLYTEKSMLKDFIPLPDKQDDKPADFFAQRIMQDEAIASSIAEWSVIPNSSQNSSSSPFMIVISDVPHVRYMGGANMRVPRIMKYLTNGDSAVDEESVTTILLNPTPETTLSLSKYLRLEIGTAPDNWDYQTKVADYLWFSKMPQVNMLPRMMRS